MTSNDHQSLTREELYNLVWAKPMTEVGKDFQISDRAMAKLCARRQVPVPPRGYWAKKSVGKASPRPPLPEIVKQPAPERKVRIKPVRQAPEKPKQSSLFEERNQTIKKALKAFRKPLSEAVDYRIRIDRWRCDYSFGLNSSYDPLHRETAMSSEFYEVPYSEYRGLVLYGAFLEPTQLKQRQFEAHLSQEPHLNKRIVEENLHRYEESPPRSVGAFLKHNHSIAAFLSIPEDAFSLVLQNAAANKINFMTIRGQKLRYGHGDIYRYYLWEEQDE
ncbi:MAG TPA: hypothetical protein VGT08_08690 [Terracidiphilus sp.]|nr:hypothetical protein [Terracidiphilus sp.]